MVFVDLVFVASHLLMPWKLILMSVPSIVDEAVHCPEKGHGTCTFTDHLNSILSAKELNKMVYNGVAAQTLRC